MNLKRLAMILIGGFALGGIALGAYLDFTEPKETPAVKVAQTASSAASKVPSLPTDPYERIVSIVENYGEFPTVTNLDDINANKPMPPYEVIIAMSAKSCFSAKEKAQHIIRDLYLDPVLSDVIIRVKVIDPEYVGVSLGASDAKRVHETIWNGGPTNFISALEEKADYDMDMVQEATSRTVTGYTYAELQSQCQ